MGIAQVIAVAPKILIVDDDAAMRSGLKELLERANFEVTAVGTFSEGRSALTHLNPDLLIVDVRLGEFNGLQLAAVRPHDIPAIVLTGFPDPVLAIEASNLGAEYLSKPVPPDALLTLVRKKLEERQHQESSSRPPRRWQRKRVTGDLRAKVEDRPVRILDVSYGGLRLEVEGQAAQSIPVSFLVDLPSSGLSLPVELVWTTRVGAAWMCGAIVAHGTQATAHAWHRFVDAVA